MKKILAIDDQQDNLITLKAVIKNHLTDCEVITALSGREGIELARKEQPDAILLDIIMPQMDGFDTCKNLKQNELTKHIPVVMITAIQTDSHSRAKGLDIGADAFISKPIDPIELIAQVKVMLRIKSAEDKLRAEKELLEEMVEKRTEALINTNKQLVVEINERKITEKKLQEALEKAKESDRLKSAFLANMSHEIRTPMNGILGFAELLKHSQLSGIKTEEYIDIIEKSSLRMLNIINNIIDVSKIEAGIMQVDVSEININDQLDYMYTFFQPEVKAKGIQFLCKKDLPDSEAHVKTDIVKFEAILTNIVKNAIVNCMEGSIEIGYKKKNNDKSELLEFYVKDTGCGIPHDKLKVIFERFIQAETDSTYIKEGAGLGLAISKAYVEALGGQIFVDSEVGKGSAFYFTIPYVEASRTDESRQEMDMVMTEEGSLKNLKILIAEDDKNSEILMKTYVEPISKELLFARTGEEAIKYCSSHPDIDLILMDIQMPKKNGLEATMEIRKTNKSVIIIAQSAYALSGDNDKAIAAGCNDYIAKPVNKDQLIKLVTKYF